MYEDLCEVLKHELDTIARKGDIDKDSLDDVHKLTSAMTMIKSLMKQDKEKDEQSKMSNNSYEQSNRTPMWNQSMNSMDSYGNRNNESYGMNSNDSYNRGGSYAMDGRSNEYYEHGESNARRGRDGDNDGRYSEDSYRRGRDMRTGRYVSRDSYDGSYERGYSRHTARERMIVKLEEMMDTATNERDRQAIMQCVEKLES
jgi:hypothetical protein